VTAALRCANGVVPGRLGVSPAAAASLRARLDALPSPSAALAAAVLYIQSQVTSARCVNLVSQCTLAIIPKTFPYGSIFPLQATEDSEARLRLLHLSWAALLQIMSLRTTFPHYYHWNNPIGTVTAAFIS
jgi:hypothetical protein